MDTAPVHCTCHSIFRRIQSVAACGWMWPDGPSSCNNYGWLSPGVAWRLPTLAPRLAPRNRRSRAADAVQVIAAGQVIGTVQTAHHRHGGHDATKITVVLEDDLDGGPADETVRFAIDGTSYEIDLSTTNAAAFRQQLAPTSNTPAGRAQNAGRDGPSLPGAQRGQPGVGPTTRASRLTAAAASLPTWSSSTRPPREDHDTSLTPRDPNHSRPLPSPAGQLCAAERPTPAHADVSEFAPTGDYV
jgi:hypothetical protein